ncbi:MAG: TolC family protein, partial [Planctomycetes bacterium]|nr:TolC family protein [Planctomycetota bacterium]
MSRRRSIWSKSGWGCLIAATALSSGCMTSNDELMFYGEPREIQEYVDQATKIDYSTYDQQSPQSVAASQPPRRIRHPRKDEIRDLSLSEALQKALGNAEIIRDNAQFLSSGNRLLAAPDAVSSIYDIAIQESNILFGQGGVAAALSDFDAVLSTQMNWGKNEFPSESGTIGFAQLDAQQEETARFNASISKAMANGSLFSIEHNINYSEVNQRTDLGSSRPFNSQFSGNPGIGMSYRMPLAQGAGAEYTRIAGTIVRRPTLQGIPTVNQGVVVARIRTDIALADFESAINNLVKDVEDSYWDLYLAYRRYDAEMLSKESALETWRRVRVKEQAELVGLSDEAQARDNYYEIRARAEDSLATLYNAELRLRRLMGLPVNDGEVIRPATEPMTAEVSLDWHSTLAEALVHRPELRKQKWNIKSLELQHKAAEKLVRPRLDFVASYAVNAFGDQLTGDGPNYHSAYATLLSGKHTNWGLGFEFSMPFGFRGAITQVQNYEHRLSKARAILAQQELEISHELANSFQQIDQAYQTAKTNFNRRRAAERRVQAFEAEYKVQRTTLDLVLRAQISLAAAETAYYSSLVSYNRALNDLKFRKGTILTENSVFLTEGVWHEESYDDALRRAWERSFAIDVSGWMNETEPEEFVFGCPTCHPDDPNAEPIPEDIELPYENPAPPLERDGAPVPPAEDRSALRGSEPEAGGLGSGLLPYDEPVLQPAQTEPTGINPQLPAEIPTRLPTSEAPLPPETVAP